MSIKSYISYTLALFLSVISLKSFSQKKDSITVVFRAVGDGEKYKFYYNNKLKLTANVTSIFLDTAFQIPRFDNYNVDEQIYAVTVSRKRKFWPSYKMLQIPIQYRDDKYLIFETNPLLRKDVALQVKWSNARPVGYHISTY